MSSPLALVQQATKVWNAGRPAEAIAILRRAAQRGERNGELLRALGMMLFKTGEVEQGLYFAKSATEAEPRNADLLYTLGAMYYSVNRAEESLAVLREAVRHNPAAAPAWNGVGNCLGVLHRYAEADEAYLKARALAPNDAEIKANHGNLYGSGGRINEAYRVFREAARQSSTTTVLTKLASASNYADGVDRAEAFETHVRYGRSLVQELRPPPPAHASTPDPDRPLRIGYLSADLMDHSIAYYLRPILAEHDRTNYPVTCFNTSPAQDAMTAELERLASGWCSLYRADDPGIVRFVREHRIDILVELSGHTLGSSLPALAYKPAPVQVSYLGYPNTTGVAAIDYRIVDAVTDPPDADAFHTEKLVRLPGCFLCYTPPAVSPEPRPPPCLERGYVTFGSFNLIRKVTPALIGAWSAILKAVPGSRLILKSLGLGVPYARDYFRQQFTDAGISAERVDMLDIVASKAEHMGMYHSVDLALDTWPYNGTTTTCEALWMGVPVVGLIGDRHAGRVGLSIMTALGLAEELVAVSPESYVRLAVGLAGDRGRLSAWRGQLRERMRASALCEAPAFARKLESAYRSMWRAWCVTRTGGGWRPAI